jgi:dTDP-4-amino-4,6-dideoxygalactose transaminase
MIYYQTPLHLQPLFAGCGTSRGEFTESERAAQEALSLPMYPELTDAHIDRVAVAVNGALIAHCS